MRNPTTEEARELIVRIGRGIIKLRDEGIDPRDISMAFAGALSIAFDGVKPEVRAQIGEAFTLAWNDKRMGGAG